MHDCRSATPEIVSNDIIATRGHTAARLRGACFALLGIVLAGQSGCAQSEAQHWAQSSPVLEAEWERMVAPQRPAMHDRHVARHDEDSDEAAPVETSEREASH